MTASKDWGRPIAAVAIALWGITATAGEINWSKVQPAFEGATFVRDEAKCAECHEDVLKSYAHTPHARAAKGPEKVADCESCHGPRSLHVETPDRSLALTALPAAEQAAVCLQCHDGNARATWKNGTHAAADVSCLSCHQVMAKTSDQALLKTAGVTDACLSCHADQRAKLLKSSHHPVREGKLDCASCHEVHGAKPALLRTDTPSDTCFSCHADKRGPFVWEHAPAREDCMSCHEPHGSNNRSLLVRKDPFLCLSCHSYGGHINLPRYNRTSNPYGSGCVNCHTSVHGSNHPSGAKLTR